MLALFDAGNRAINGCVHLGIRGSLLGVLWAFGRELYTAFTAVGSASVRLYIGEEMYQILLSDDTLLWPWEAFIRLPWIPLNALIGSYLSIANVLWDPLPAFLIWPATTAAAHHRAPPFTGSLFSIDVRDAFARGATAAWPPSPGFVHFLGIPAARFAYLFYRGRLVRRIAGIPSQERTAAGSLRRLVDDSDSEDEDEEEEEPADEVAAVQRRVGRNGWLARAGNAFLTPFYANGMGWALGETARHVQWLKTALAIRPPLNPAAAIPAPLLTPLDFWKSGAMKDKSTVTTFFRVFWGGTGLWASADPVWFRNIVGLGMFIVAKDALYALHLRYALREIKSRKIISRDFAGIDRSTLDLIPR